MAADRLELDHVRAPDDQRVKEYLSVGVFHPTLSSRRTSAVCVLTPVFS